MISAYMWLLCVLPLTISWVDLAVRRRLPTGGATDRRDPGDKRPPPGPRPLPLVGNLLQLDDQPHRSLSRLARVHGPLMSLRLGRVPVVVVSSPSVAKQVLHTHDHSLSARAAPDATSAHAYNQHSMVWLPPAAQWRRLRRLCNTHLFNPQLLDASRGLRLKKVRELVSFVGECSRAGKAVDVGRAAATATLNLISNTLFSADVAGHGAESSAEFKGLVRNIMEEAGGPNVADYFPLLRWADPQGRRRRFSLYVGRLRQLFEEMMDGRLKSRSGGAGADAEDFLDALLDSHATSQLDRPTILSLLVDLFCAGSDTSSTTVEWAMAELLHSPRAMAKARSELEDVAKSVGIEMIEESDLGRMPYLQAVVKETLRLHPPVSLLIPRRAGAAVEISTGGGQGGTYTVPEGATVLVNAWAIGRDPGTWGSEAEAFLPERFLEGEAAGVDWRGFDMELIPFGAGRRICPGLPLAARMVPLLLSNLLWCFEWELPEGMAPGDVDMMETFGITLCKTQPLLAIPRPK